MKKYSFLFAVLVLICQLVEGQNFNQLSFNNINGQPINLEAYAGKKVFIFIVPLSQTSSHYSQLQQFKSRYGDTVQIIGIPSIEDGYQSSAAQGLQTLYKELGIVLTEGMYTKKASANQSLLLKWLTDKTKNMHYDLDSKGIGTKFFVSGGGVLFAVLPPQAGLAIPLVDKIVHSTGSL